MKKLAFLIVALLVTFSLLPSCAPSVPKADYDKVASDLSTLQAQNKQVQTDLSAALALTQQLQSDLTKKDSQFQSDLAKKDGELQAANDKITQIKLRIEILNALLLPAFSGKQMTVSQQLDAFNEMREKVKATGDIQLIAKLDAVVEAVAIQTKNPSDANLLAANTATRTFYNYLLETMPETLQDATF